MFPTHTQTHPERPRLHRGASAWLPGRLAAGQFLFLFFSPVLMAVRRLVVTQCMASPQGVFLRLSVNRTWVIPLFCLEVLLWLCRRYAGSSGEVPETLEREARGLPPLRLVFV